MNFNYILPSVAWLVLAIAPIHSGVAQQQNLELKGEVLQPPQPGDIVRLKIWREPDLSGDYRVDENGVAVFPKIGSLVVMRMPPDSLTKLLVTDYSAFLENPSVEVTLLRRVNVLGEVKNAGIYYVDPTMTVADVLAMAGGITQDGNAAHVELFRNGVRILANISLQSQIAASPVQSGDQFRVPQRSWVARNAAAVIAASISGVALLAATLIRN